MKGEVSYLSEKLGEIQESIDAQQQYSRINCLLLHGTEETRGEDTDNIVLEVLSNVKYIEDCSWPFLTALENVFFLRFGQFKVK